jgi:hypothetical protein
MLIPRDSALRREQGNVLLNYHSLLPTEGPEKQQQTRLLLGSIEFSNRQQYVSTC